MPIYSTPFEFDCINVNVKTGIVCLPLIDNCDILDPEQPDNWYTYDGGEWNNNLCQTDECYFIPFAEGDKIQFQTWFLDPNRDSPTDYNDLILISAYDEKDELLVYFANAYGVRRMSGWDEKNKRNYQIIEMDTTTWPDCVKFKFLSNDTIITTGTFRRLPNCRRTFTLKSDYGAYDCLGFYYGEPDEYAGDLIKYDNTMRYYGEIKLDGNSISKNRLGNSATTGTIITNWKIILAKMIPPYIKTIMVEQHFAGEKVYVDGKQYLFDDISIETEETKNNMFFFTVKPQKVCNVNYRC